MQKQIWNLNQIQKQTQVQIQVQMQIQCKNKHKYKLQRVFCTNWTFAGNTTITGKMACRDHLTVGTEKLRNG